MATNLNTKRYRSKDLNIPFYESNTKLHKVKLKVDKITSQEDFIDRRTILIELALNEYITYYLPEFYSYLFDRPYFQNEVEDSDIDLAVRLLQEIRERINPGSWFETSPPSEFSYIVFDTSYNFDDKREALEQPAIGQVIGGEPQPPPESVDRMPSYLDNLKFFNDREGIAGQIAQTTLTIGTIGKDNKLLNNGLRTFDTQYKGFEGQIEPTVDFGFLQASSQKILNILITELTKQLRSDAPSYNFSDADTMTIIFGKGPRDVLAISRIDYLLIEDSIQSQPMKQGYFSNIKYNKNLQDPLTLAVLRNYRQLLNSIQNGRREGSPYSFFEFMSDPSVLDSLNSTGTIFDNFNRQPKKELANEMLNVAADYGLIDVDNTDELEKGFKTFFKSEEYKKLKEQVADNPDIYKRVYASQKAKVLNTGVDITKAIGNVLETGPMGFIEKSPEVKYLFRQLGLDELAKEAFLCLTFGLNFEVGRLNKAVQNSLVRTSSSIYYKPDVSKPSIKKPKIDLDSFKPFTISGDMWKELEKVIVDILQETVLGIVKKLAELLRENCNLNSPRSSDYGANDISDFIDDSTLPFVGEGSSLDQLSAKNKLSTELLLKYLRDLSDILSSIELCILFLNREDAPSELINRILEFNSTYSEPAIRDRLNSISAIMGFFADLAAIVDVSELCNQIANELYLLNQDNVCLNEGDLDDENLRELLDLIENGLVVTPPDFDLECPDSEFLDPTISKSIPEAFSALAETIELQFISSADSAREILLEPVFQNESRVLTNFADAGIEVTGSSVNTDFLAPIIGAFTAASDFSADKCDVDIADLLGFDAAAAVGAVEAATGVVNTALKSPEFANAINGITQKLETLNASAQSENPVFTTYQFNQNFYNKFNDYIDMTTFDFPQQDRRGSATQEFYRSSGRAPTRDGTHADNYYTPITLEFSFASLADSESFDSLKLEYPRSADPDGQLSLKFNSTNNFIKATSLDIFIPDQPEIDNTPGENIYVKKFVDALAPDDAASRLTAIYSEFPYAYGRLVGNVFDYIIENGVFDAASLQSLNFFNTNEGCPPEEVSDLLDIDGIIQQMMAEYKESACSREDVPLNSKISNVLKLGMYYMLIQIHIAEFFIKNIFVMSAFKIDDLLDPNYFIFQLMRDQVLISLRSYFGKEKIFQERITELDLIKYFNLKIKRENVIANGGISDSEGVVIFEPGVQFTINDTTPYGFTEIIDYMIRERLFIGKNSLNNAIKNSLPDNNPVSYNEALLSTFVILDYDGNSQPTATQVHDVINIDNFVKEPKDNFFIVKNSNSSNQVIHSLWYNNSQASYKLLDRFYVSSVSSTGQGQNGFAPIGGDSSESEDGSDGFGSDINP